MRYVDFHLAAHDATKLFVRCYSPEEIHPAQNRSLVIVHGTSEHGGRYDHVARAAVEQGWQVIVPDLRGHGQSVGVPVHVDRFERYLLDLDTLWQYFELNPRRTALLGHSFGGMISARFAQTRPNRVATLTMMSPLLGLKVEVDRFTLCIGKLMSLLMPTTRFKSRVPAEHTCSNPEVLKRREVDPLIHRSVTAAWFFQMKQALADVWTESKAVTIPLLLMQAGADQIVDPAASERWIKTVGSSDVGFQNLEGHYHELLNELDWPTTLDAVMEWLEARIPSMSVSLG